MARQRGHVAAEELSAVKAAGYDDAERWWEDAVEHRHTGDPFDAVGEAMTAAREGVATPTGVEAQREATMRITLRAAIKEGFARIAVVCGAWHVPALAVLWVAPVALMHYVVGVPEIFHWLLPISEKTWSPSVEALICYALPVWISFLAFLIVARMGKSILVQNIVSAVVSAILLFVVSPNLTAAILRALTGH